MLKDILDFHFGKVTLTLVAFTELLLFSVSFLYMSDAIYFQTFGGQLTSERIEVFIEQAKEMHWLSYVIVFIVLIARVSYSAICLYTGFYLVDNKVRFCDLFKVVLLADFVFVAAGIVKLVILIFFIRVNTLDDLQFQPLSLMQLFDKTSVDTMLIYPLSLLNVFEVLYWLVLAWLLTEVAEKPLRSTLKTVASSYGTGLLLWVLFVMFLTVNLS